MFKEDQKLMLLKDEEQVFYPQQTVYFVAMALQPNQGTAIVKNNDGQFILIRPKFLIDFKEYHHPTPNPTPPKKIA